MTSGPTDDVSLLDRLVARWEVSRLSVVPVVFSSVLFWAGLVMLAVITKVTGTKPVMAARLLGVTWLVVVALEIGRGLWSLRHRYASPRWLRAVRAAVGDEVVLHALAELIRVHAFEPDYVVTRAEMVSAVQGQRAKRRDAARRTEGFRLVEASSPEPEPEPGRASARISDEQRARARERRAARRAAGTA